VRLIDYLDKGASLGPEAPCLTTGGRTLTYFGKRNGNGEGEESG